jgi:hypothetical protein
MESIGTQHIKEKIMAHITGKQVCEQAQAVVNELENAPIKLATIEAMAKAADAQKFQLYEKDEKKAATAKMVAEKHEVHNQHVIDALTLAAKIVGKMSGDVYRKNSANYQVAALQGKTMQEELMQIVCSSLK